MRLSGLVAGNGGKFFPTPAFAGLNVGRPPRVDWDVKELFPYGETSRLWPVPFVAACSSRAPHDKPRVGRRLTRRREVAGFLIQSQKT